MSTTIDKRNNGRVFIEADSWKIFALILFAMTMILSLVDHPLATAQENDAVLFLPVIIGPSLPGSSGTIVHTIGAGITRELYAINADGSGRIRLTKNDAVDDMPAWSADGTTILFTSDRREAGHYELYRMNRDGSGVKRLTNSQWDDNSPSFSPDGGQIVFASNRNGVFQIFIMNSDGSGQKALTGDDYESGSPEWSADGSKIVFASSKNGGIEIYVMNPDGSGMTRLTTSGGPDFSPAMSPDGKQIVFTSLRDGGRRIYIMNANGSGQRRLTTAFSDWADWSPDGARIVFTRRPGESTVASGDGAELATIDAHLLFAHHQAVDNSDTDLYTMNPDGGDKQPVSVTPWNKEDRGNWGL